MVRDRLDELKTRTSQIRSNYRPMETNVQIEEDRLKNVFRLAEQIGEGIERISENTKICGRYMKQLSESPFDEKGLGEEITALFQRNGELSRNLTPKLKKLEDQVTNTNKTCTIGRIEMIQYNTLKMRFRECLNKNNEQMESFRRHRINTYKAQLRIKGVQVTDEEVAEILNGEQQQIFTDNILLETAETKRLLAEAEELNEQLLKIENLIREVRDLFVQMSVLVEEQQELVDVVEYQTQKAVEYIYKTPNILREAEGKKRKALKMKITCFGIIGIVILIIILSFFYT